MIARIYKPAKTAMQSGNAKTKEWMLDYEPEQPREIDPLMGWTSSGDMRQQVRLRFDTAEEAVAYCERHGIAYQVFETHAPRAPRDLVFRQFLLQALRSLDALSGPPSIGRRTWLATHSEAPAPAAIAAIRRKNRSFAMLLQKPPR